MSAPSEVTREMALYVTEAFYAYEAVRDARDEALTRCGELEDQRDEYWRLLFTACAERDQARRVAASLEAEVAKVRALHSEQSNQSGNWCGTCFDPWPCVTAEAVFLT